MARRNLTSAEWRQYFDSQPYQKTCKQWRVHPTLYAEAAELAASDFESEVQAAEALFEQIASIESEHFSLSDAEQALARAKANNLIKHMYNSIATFQIPLAVEQYREAYALDPALDYSESLNATFCYLGAIYEHGSLVSSLCEWGIDHVEQELATNDSVSDLSSFFQLYKGNAIAKAQNGDFDTAVLYLRAVIAARANGHGNYDTELIDKTD